MADPLVELCAEPEISEEGALDRREHLSQLLSPETVLEAQSLSSPSESDSKPMQEPLWGEQPMPARKSPVGAQNRSNWCRCQGAGQRTLLTPAFLSSLLPSLIPAGIAAQWT